MNTISERLRNERNRLGLTQDELATLGGVGRRAQVNYESGERCPDGRYFEAIAKAGVDVQYILTGVRSDSAACGDGEPKSADSDFRVATMLTNSVGNSESGYFGIKTITYDNSEIAAADAGAISDLGAEVGSASGGGDRFKDRFLIALRDESVYAFAKRTGLSESLIRKYLNGASSPGLDNATLIARTLGVSLDWLATGEGDGAREKDARPPQDAALDADTLTQAVELFEEALATRGLTMAPRQKADAFVQIYSLLMKKKIEEREAVGRFAAQLMESLAP